MSPRSPYVVIQLFAIHLERQTIPVQLFHRLSYIVTSSRDQVQMWIEVFNFFNSVMDQIIGDAMQNGGAEPGVRRIGRGGEDDGDYEEGDEEGGEEGDGEGEEGEDDIEVDGDGSDSFDSVDQPD